MDKRSEPDAGVEQNLILSRVTGSRNGRLEYTDPSDLETVKERIDRPKGKIRRRSASDSPEKQAYDLEVRLIAIK